MAEHKEGAKEHIGVVAKASALYTEATFQRIAEDAIYLREQAGRYQIDNGQGKRYARLIILLAAFYLESFSNLIFQEVADTELNNLDNRPDLPESIRRFRAVHKKLLGKELRINVDGIRDIFTIRNRVIAHPAGRAQLQVAGVKEGRLDIHVDYIKFKHFPTVYSWFTVAHADEVLTEVREFLTEFIDLLRCKITEEQVKEWWPAQLTKWSGEVSNRE